MNRWEVQREKDRRLVKKKKKKENGGGREIDSRDSPLSNEWNPGRTIEKDPC